MALTFYMDHHVPRAITVGLRLRGIDVLTAYEDDRSELDDPQLLDRATELKRVLFTQDDDLLAEAARRQKADTFFLWRYLRPSTACVHRDLHSRS